MKRANKLLPLVQSFFQEYLIANRGLSQNTVKSYRDALKLFFAFESIRQNKPAIKLELDDLNAEAILAFLNQQECSRISIILSHIHVRQA